MMNRANAPRLSALAAPGIILRAALGVLVAEVLGATVVVVRAVVEIVDELRVELEPELEPAAPLLDAPLVGAEMFVSTGVALSALTVIEFPEDDWPLHVACPAAFRPQVSPDAKDRVRTRV